MRDSFEEYRKLITSTHTRTLNFQQYGGNYIKTSKMSPDAYVQVAFQLTYYKMYGRNDATYESASTRSFLHGRTETVRSVTSAVADLCHAVTTQPLFAPHARTTLPRPIALLRSALDAHVNYMRQAKAGTGVDRHLLGLRLICLEAGIDLPTLFTDAAFSKSSRWRLSTSHCGSTSLQLFGFGPVVPDGYGLGYMIKNDSISVCVTSNSAHPQGSSSLFARVLESTLLQMSSIIDAEKFHVQDEDAEIAYEFVHPTASMCDFDYEPGVGFKYRSRQRGTSLYGGRQSSFTASTDSQAPLTPLTTGGPDSSSAKKYSLTNSSPFKVVSTHDNTVVEAAQPPLGLPTSTTPQLTKTPPNSPAEVVQKTGATTPSQTRTPEGEGTSATRQAFEEGNSMEEASTQKVTPMKKKNEDETAAVIATPLKAAEEATEKIESGGETESILVVHVDPSNELPRRSVSGQRLLFGPSQQQPTTAPLWTNLGIAPGISVPPTVPPLKYVPSHSGALPEKKKATLGDFGVGKANPSTQKLVKPGAAKKF